MNNRFLFLNSEWAFTEDEHNIILFHFTIGSEEIISCHGYYPNWNDALNGAIEKQVNYDDVEKFAKRLMIERG